MSAHFKLNLPRKQPQSTHEPPSIVLITNYQVWILCIHHSIFWPPFNWSILRAYQNEANTSKSLQGNLGLLGGVMFHAQNSTNSDKA